MAGRWWSDVTADFRGSGVGERGVHDRRPQYYNVNLAADTDAATVTGDIGNPGDQMTFDTMLGPWPNQDPIAMHCQHGVAFCKSVADSSTSNHTGFSSITLTAIGGTSWTAGDFALDLAVAPWYRNVRGF